MRQNDKIRYHCKINKRRNNPRINKRIQHNDKVTYVLDAVRCKTQRQYRVNLRAEANTESRPRVGGRQSSHERSAACLLNVARQNGQSRAFTGPIHACKCHTAIK